MYVDFYRNNGREYWRDVDGTRIYVDDWEKSKASSAGLDLYEFGRKFHQKVSPYIQESFRQGVRGYQRLKGAWYWAQNLAERTYRPYWWNRDEHATQIGFRGDPLTFATARSDPGKEVQHQLRLLAAEKKWDEYNRHKEGISPPVDPAKADLQKRLRFQRHLAALRRHNWKKRRGKKWRKRRFYSY